MDTSDEPSELATVILCLVCHDADLEKEYDFIANEVLPRLCLWCRSLKVKLLVNHCRLKENVVEDIVNSLKCNYVKTTKPRTYVSFIVNLMSERQVESTQSIGDADAELANEFGCKETSTQSLFFLFRNACSACFPGIQANYKSLFKQGDQNDRVLPLTCKCRYCEDSSSEIRNVLSCKMFLDFLQDRISIKLKSVDHFLHVETNDRLSQHLFLQTSLLSLAAADSAPAHDSAIQQILAYVNDTDSQVPLLLHGETGSSKTSIMAAAVLRVIGRNLNSDPRQQSLSTVFFHFGGLLPKSAELDVFLKSLMMELNLSENESTSVDISTAVQWCHGALSNPAGPPIIIFVDSVDLFDDFVAGQNMKWIPLTLAPRVRLILSATTGSSAHTTLHARTNLPVELIVNSSDCTSRGALLDDICSSLSPDSVSAIIGNLSSWSPLWSTRSASDLLCHVAPPYGALDDLTSTSETLPKNLETMWIEILSRLEHRPHRDQLISTLSLLTSSAAGLRKSELCSLLTLKPAMPPSPFEEKADAEVPEKALNDVETKSLPPLPMKQLDKVLDDLKSCVIRLQDGVDDRFYIRHESLRTTVRNRYSMISDDQSDSEDVSCFWHQKLAGFFQNLPDSDRKFEEYLYQLCQLEDADGLANYLTLWSVFDRLYTEEYSTILLTYWKKAGGANEMIAHYKMALRELEAEKVEVDYNTLALRHEQVARLFILAGKYAEALVLATLALKWEEMELGKRPERMVELYGLLTDVYDEKLKLQDFISPSQIPDLRRTISYGRKSIDLRQQFTSRYHKFKLGISLMKLAFSLESWAGCGGDGTLVTSVALTEGQGHANRAIEIFKELNDRSHYAEALMTKGILSPRGTPEQLRFYHEALDICQEVNGENHILTSRIYINIGIVYEDNKDYVQAYKYFANWARVNEVVLGPSHPKTMRARRVLREPRYMYIASRLKDLERQVDEGDRDNVLTEEIINKKAQQFNESAQARSEDENSEDDEECDTEEPDVLDVMRPGHNTLFNLASELRRTIEEMLLHAMQESQDNAIQTLFSDNRMADSDDDCSGGSMIDLGNS